MENLSMKSVILLENFVEIRSNSSKNFPSLAGRKFHRRLVRILKNKETSEIYFEVFKRNSAGKFILEYSVIPENFITVTRLPGFDKHIVEIKIKSRPTLESKIFF